MRFKDSVRLLWADALCINQEDLLERAHQVNIMKNIFQRASRVLIWLGPEKESNLAMFLLKSLHRERLESKAIPSSHLASLPYPSVIACHKLM
jgi:hypothetical protein